MISRPSSARMSAAYVEASSADAISNIDGLGRGVKGVANQEALQRILERPDEKAIEKVVDAHGDGKNQHNDLASRRVQEWTLLTSLGCRQESSQWVG